ncbi:MAG: YhbY family RNA-binding protein [Proteobacteria bacterium]|nr:YhbY family RNA-binding protein [Burkholderiales bacterium]
MSAIVLSAPERKALKAEAHALSPVAAIGKAGITEAVLKEVEVCLRSHHLIKVRAGSDDKSQREQWIATLAERLDCAAVQTIGRILVLWRPPPDEPASTMPADRAARKTPAAPRRRRVKRSYQ